MLPFYTTRSWLNENNSDIYLVPSMVCISKGFVEHIKFMGANAFQTLKKKTFPIGQLKIQIGGGNSSMDDLLYV